MVTAENITFDLGRGNDHGIDWCISGLYYLIDGTWYVVAVINIFFWF